ncbi:MAG: FAD-binding oxidoreductase [Lentisphaeria bacterium]|nr:FAD-binding oxidoreductase [Lentisphaeria bacterium]
MNVIHVTNSAARGMYDGKLFTGEELRAVTGCLRDESRREGQAEAVAFPRSLNDVSSLLKLAAERHWSVTVSGARTGITAGAVPNGGLVICLERMNRFSGLRRGEDGTLLLTCEAGVTLADIRHAVATGVFADSAQWRDEEKKLAKTLASGRWSFPPDPTETSASIGGMAACNASGAHTFSYGQTRSYIESARVVLADGNLLNLRRGQARADETGALILRYPDGHERRLQTPGYAQPRTKNAAGYFSGDHLDALDLFIGSEGTLGVIAAVEIRLVPRAETCSAQVVFWENEGKALAFVRQLRDEKQALGVEAIEYFDSHALAFLRRRREVLGAASAVPACLPTGAGCGVYVDLGVDKEALLSVLRRLSDIIARLGGRLEDTWSAHTANEREKLRMFRHALPESVNAFIAEQRKKYPDLTKLGTDMAVPDEHLETIMRLYHRTLSQAGLTYVIFGHIGDNHVHVNILPATPEEYAAGKKVYMNLARAVVAMGGSPAAEHGVGKLKRDLLALLFGEEGIRQMRAIKAVFDPDSRLSPGNLFTVIP